MEEIFYLKKGLKVPLCHQLKKIERTRGCRGRQFSAEKQETFLPPLEGKTYADELEEVLQKAEPDERVAVIKGLRKSRAGGLLVEFTEVKTFVS
ncbi:hypothetical protein J6590_033616, partial [Homalodisca vitripennis]